MPELVPVRVRDCACPDSPPADGDIVYMAPMLDVDGGSEAERDLVEAAGDERLLQRRWLRTFITYGARDWNLVDAAGEPVPFDVSAILDDWTLARPVGDAGSDLYVESVTAPFPMHRRPLPRSSVIDTGVDYTHPDLAGKIIKGKDYVNDDNDPMDDQGHGTDVGGVIAAKTNNFFGIAGISWNSKVLAIKVCNHSGRCPLFETTLGIRYAANNLDVKIMNMSLGFPFSSTLQEAVEYAVVDKKKLLVASAGNDGLSTPSYPAGLSTTYPGRVLAVAAHGGDHCRASFSNYGTWVSTTAPGVDVISTVPSSIYGSDFANFSGTLPSGAGHRVQDALDDLALDGGRQRIEIGARWDLAGRIHDETKLASIHRRRVPISSAPSR